MLKSSFVLILSFLLLGGCTSEKNEAITAKEDDLRSKIFASVDSPDSTLSFTDTGLEINIDTTLNKVTPDTKPSDITPSSSLEKVIDPVKIDVDKDMYILSDEDDFSLILKKIGDRIIRDEEGNEYHTSQK